MKLKDIKGKVIHCKTKEEATQLIETIGGQSHWIRNWEIYRERTCYRFYNDGTIAGYCNIHYYRDENGYEITEFSDLIIPEETESPLTATEVLTWLKEHYMGGTYSEVFGEDYILIDLLGDLSADEIVKRISDYKKKSEVKPLEFAWEYICRIIKVEDNGVKKCVHEEPVTTNIYVESQTILSKYISEHEGKYFATVENICRVKE